MTAQWQPGKLAVFSAGLRWEREQLPPPIAALANPSPVHGKAAQPRQQLGPARQPRHRQRPKAAGRCCAWAMACTTAAPKTPPSKPRSPRPALLTRRSQFLHAPHRRLHSMTGPAVLRRSLTCSPAAGQAWSSRERSSSRPTSATPKFTRPSLPSSSRCPATSQLTAGAMLSLGRRLPVSIDTNFDPSLCNIALADHYLRRCSDRPPANGPIKTCQAARSRFPSTLPGRRGLPHASDPPALRGGWINRLSADARS